MAPCQPQRLPQDDLGLALGSPTSLEGLLVKILPNMTKHGVLQGRGAHAIYTRIMVFREVFIIFIKVSSGSAPGTHVDAVGTILESYW